MSDIRDSRTTRCIEHTHAGKVGTSWCRRAIDGFEWSFRSLDHAAYSASQGQLQVPCRRCVKAAKDALSGKRARG